MNLYILGEYLLRALKEGESVECTAIQDGCCWSGVILLTNSEGTVHKITTPPVYVSSDIACGGVEFLVASIRLCLVERKPVKSWEAPVPETRVARLSA